MIKTEIISVLGQNSKIQIIQINLSTISFSEYLWLYLVSESDNIRHLCLSPHLSISD